MFRPEKLELTNFKGILRRAWNEVCVDFTYIHTSSYRSRMMLRQTFINRAGPAKYVVILNWLLCALSHLCRPS